VAVTAKPDEIPAVRDLLKAFASLAGAVITIGALHTQSDTAQVITGRGADYVMTVKGIMPALCRQLKKLPWARVPAVSAVSTDHGRRSRRTIQAVLAPAWIGFVGAAQVAQLRRTVTKKLHWVRDVTCQEDRSLVRTGNAPWVMASLRIL
jgi:predicted transposase YbfD/YdcC